jgi:GxxExxY protein
MALTNENLTGRIIGCIFEVHRELGPGFLEGVYKRALAVELAHQSLPSVREHEVRVHYRSEVVGIHRIDILVGESVIVEAKAVDHIVNEHYDQVRSYLKATGLRVGLLVNFAGVRAEYRRIES